MALAHQSSVRGRNGSLEPGRAEDRRTAYAEAAVEKRHHFADAGLRAAEMLRHPSFGTDRRQGLVARAGSWSLWSPRWCFCQLLPTRPELRAYSVSADCVGVVLHMLP